MKATTEEIFIEALALPTRARVALVQKLLVRLEAEPGAPDIEQAWIEEGQKRCQAACLR